MKTTKIIGGVLIAAGTGAIVYFGFIKKFADGLTGWQKMMGPKKAKGVLEEETRPTAPVAQQYTPSPLASGFPMTGGRHEKTRELQKALQTLWGQVIAGAPSDTLGKNTVEALKKIGYDLPISKADFENILAKKPRGGSMAPPTATIKYVYSKKALTPIYTKVDDVVPYRMAGVDELVGEFSGTKTSYFGTIYNEALVLGEKKYIAKENSYIK